MTTAYHLHPPFRAHWHKLSFDRFLFERLPALLREHLPLTGCHVLEDGPDQFRIQVELNGAEPLAVTYGPLPRCDEQGLFMINQRPVVVVPTASQEELDQASIACVGEQMEAALEAHLLQLPADLAWDEPSARGFLALDAWINDFLTAKAQPLDTTNWYSRHTHLRRLLIPSRARVITASQMGRVDPFETPEGPMIGRVFTVASGAEIDVASGRLVIRRAQPDGMLGPNALMIPFLEHDDANRLLMGNNMMRQGLVPPEPEPALVQTGFEPPDAGPDFWNGRNLLTAFVFGGEGAVEDGLILSHSAARRLNYPYPVEPGDKIANRHGTKGVVSQVLPDAEMPHLPDGTPVEMLYSFSGLANRLNFGQEREALMGSIARAEGRPALVPPFQAPSVEQIRARLAVAGLPEDGMYRLRWGKDGEEMPLRSTVGWVYWLRLAHLARPKLRVAGRDGFSHDGGWGKEWGEQAATRQPVGEAEIDLLRELGAPRMALELLHGNRPAPHGEATPYLLGLAERLLPAGIRVGLAGERLVVDFAEPPAPALVLARPLPHPWLSERRIRSVGQPPQASGEAARQTFAALVEANDRLARWQGSTPDSQAQDDSPQGEAGASSYRASLSAQLQNRLQAYFETLLPTHSMQVTLELECSGRAVIAPAVGLHLDQVGLPEPFIQGWFAPQAAEQGRPLAEILAESWVVIERQPALSPTMLIAFHPVAVDGPAIRLNPQVTALLDADFDGDQLLAFLPRSSESQREAGERLSVAAHLRRDPGLVSNLLKIHEIIWGLAWRSLDPAQAAETARLLGTDPARLPVPLSERALFEAAHALLDRLGVQETLPVLEALAQRGYAAARASGASLSPFPMDALIGLQPQPASEDINTWQVYLESLAEQILAHRDYTNPVLGPQLLSAAVRSRARRILPFLLGPRIGEGPDERKVIIRGSNVQGIRPEELPAWVAGARRGLAALAARLEDMLQPGLPSIGSTTDVSPTSLLARARRARTPGLIFARAAASAESDTLHDPLTRLLVGVL